MAENKEELKSLLIKVKEQSRKAGLKLNMQKNKESANEENTITSWQIDGETMETVRDSAPKSLQMVTAIMKLKRHLLLGRKVITNLDSVLKNRDITLPKKAHLVKAMVFPVVIYRCDSWTIKKAEC